MKIFDKIGMRLLIAILFASISCFSFGQAVTTNANAGPGSLRDAIIFANANPGTTITFNFGGGPSTITLLTPLPAIVSPTIIQGFSEPASVAGPIGSRVINVGINCNGLPGNGLTILSTNVDISGLAIYNSGGNGIFLAGGFDLLKVWGCNIGTDLTGTTAGIGNFLDGIHIGDGILPTSSVIIGSEGDGINDLSEGNVIVGNAGTNISNGVAFQLSNTARVSGNYVGIGSNGTTSIANGLAGILFTDGSTANIVGVDDNTSTLLDQVNFIGNNVAGILFYNGSNDNFVSGNSIGVGPGGIPAGNISTGIPPLFGAGVAIWGSSGNLIGTNANGNSDIQEANVIGFNVVGVLILAFDPGGLRPNPNDASNNLVMGNDIGTDPFNTLVYGNTLYGVLLSVDGPLNVTGNIVGADGFQTPALSAAQANIIFNNGIGGIASRQGDLTGTINQNRFSRNSFFNNLGGTPGISIANNFSAAITPNDCGDADTGPNDLFNRPVIASIVSDATNMVIKGWAAPNSTLEFHISSGTINPPVLGGSPPVATQIFGEPISYLITTTEGDDGSISGFADLDNNTTSSYPDDGTAVSCQENAFTFVIPLTALQTFYAPGDRIVALAFDNGFGAANTSEASSIALSILPVTLTEFSGKLVESQSILKWTTASESNSHHFDVERSTDGKKFITLGRVAAMGNSNSLVHYNYTDATPVTGLNYYRLKQVDKDGKYVYSQTVVIRNNGAFARTQIIPNPVHNSATVSIMLSQKEDLQLRLFDGTGKLTRTYKVSGNGGENQIYLNDLGTLPTGIYTLDIRGQKTSLQQKLVKY